MLLKNRLIRGSVGDYCLFKEGHLTDEALKLYEQLSDNGVSIVYTGATIINENSLNPFSIFRFDKDEYIEEYKKLSYIVHKNKAYIIMQLVESGLKMESGKENYYSPSKVKNPFYVV